MKIEKILVGTVDEITDHCVELTKEARNLGGKNLLYTRDGFISQITGNAWEGDKNSPIRPPDMGMVFYLTRHDSSTEKDVNLELRSVYYRVMDDIPLKVDKKK